MKEQIIINGEVYNPCNGCELWDGEYCTGDKSYEPNGKIHGIICDRHIAEQFWKVRNELIHKIQEYEELKEYKAVVDELAGKQIILTNKDKMPKLYENAKDLKLNRYRKALEEIEKLTKDFKKDICNVCGWRNTDECSPSGTVCEYAFNILNIINKVKSENN